MGVVKKKGKAERSDDTEQQSATLEESSSGSRGRGKRWTGLMLWIHGPGGVGDEVPLEAKKGGSFREPLSTILLTIRLGPGLDALIKKGREEKHVLRCSTAMMAVVRRSWHLAGFAGEASLQRRREDSRCLSHVQPNACGGGLTWLSSGWRQRSCS